jgi:aspartate aminotransferase
MVIEQSLAVSHRGRIAPPSPVRKLSPVAAAAKSRGITVLHVNIGQPDIPTPQPILDAIRGFADAVIPYAPSRGYPAVLEAWATYYGIQGHDVTSDQFLVTTGGSEALWFAFMAVADPGDEILMFEPTYANYFGFAATSGINPVAVMTSPDNAFHLPSASEIERHITPRTKAICIANPNNPTGTVYDRAELGMLVDLARTYDLFLISDETYRELVFDGLRHLGMLDFTDSNVADRVIVVDSVSKRFSATGARVGCLVSRNPDVIDAVGRFAQARLSVSTVEQLAVVPMLLDPVGYTDWLRDEYERRRDVVYERLQSAGIGCRKPSGAFYVMVDLPVDDSDDFARWLLSDFSSDGETVMIAPGAGFYFTPAAGATQARIAYVLNERRLGRAVEILDQALKAYPGATT